MATIAFCLAAFAAGYVVGAIVEWNLAAKREDLLRARLDYIAWERHDAERVIGALREVIARGGNE